MDHPDQPDSTQDYYARRAAQERTLAEKAADPSARLVHVELAARYTEIVTHEPDQSPS